MRNRPTHRSDDRDSLQVSASGAPRLDLVVVASPVTSRLGFSLSLGASPVALARVADGTTEDDWMSREHATAQVVDGVVKVRDGAAFGDGWKASANGTYAMTAALRDEARVEGEVVVAPRRVIRTGRTLWMLVENAAPTPPGSLLVGVSDALGRVRDELSLLVAEVALRFERNKRVTQSLLVTGPRGTGKQVVAREAHRLLVAARSEGSLPFVDVPAPALADGTSGADIFGVVDKYATDVKARPGYFERAHGGVLLIDEVADLPAAEQAKLLNLLEERQVTRLGGRAPVAFDCLVIAATNRDLDELVEEGSFRADLLDRLSRFRVHLPALETRPEDVLLLAHALLQRQAFSGSVSWEVAIDLLRRPWRGSVRELDAFVERLVALARAGGRDEIDRTMCDKAARALKATSPLQLTGAGIAAAKARSAGAAASPEETPSSAVGRAPPRDELLRCLVANGWNKTEVGRLYGKQPRQITRWMEYLAITRPPE